MFFSRLLHICVGPSALMCGALLVTSVNAADLRLVDFSMVQVGGLLALSDSQVTNIRNSSDATLRVATGHHET